jgi:hypothetical protein
MSVLERIANGILGNERDFRDTIIPGKNSGGYGCRSNIYSFILETKL